MPKINPEIETFARIKVIGVGGSGANAINHMIDSKITGVEFIAVNTDTQDLHHSKANKKIHIGKNLTKGLGSGMNPEIGRASAEETKAEIQEAIKGADMVFIAAGMGGGTGTGASPIIAKTAKEAGILTIGVVTKPFSFEGAQRQKIADQGIEDLEKEVDALVTIPNDRLLIVAGDNMSFKDAFATSDDILRQAVEGISDLITTPGIINIDYADIETTLKNAGAAFMGIGIKSGNERAKEAALEAINSPLLDIEIEGAKGVLFAISAGDDLTMNEVNEIASTITESIDSNARVIFGTIHDTKLKKGEIKVTVIATGFDGIVSKKPALSPLARRNETESIPEPADEPIKSKKLKNQIEEIEIIEEIDDSEDDDWSVMPAFLRPKK
ncbi:MAG: cell division protein FtsZ [Candidatus Pacebacteria bacterium]|nr:cell division protein FtsZ [Candidatus Paceibacterota bacterium]